MRRHAIRFWGLPAISALATMLVAASVDPGGNWARLRAVPQAERERLVENLRKFDILYSPGQQRSLRELDDKINRLDPLQQLQYLAAAHRYHNWLASLPEIKQDELNAKPPGERMALIKQLVDDHPVPRATTAHFLQFVDVGDHSPFELAAIYQIWQTMSEPERAQVERLPPGPRRKSFLQRGEKKKIAAELKRQGYNEALWIEELEAFAEKRKNAFLLPELKSLDDGRLSEIRRRQAINLHFLDETHRPKPVDEDRLDAFLASFPPWLQTRFDHQLPDEARRRLTVVYRLIFPPGHEITMGASPTQSPPGVRTAPARPAGGPGPGAKRPPAGGAAPF